MPSGEIGRKERGICIDETIDLFPDCGGIEPTPLRTGMEMVDQDAALIRICGDRSHVGVSLVGHAPQQGAMPPRNDPLLGRFHVGTCSGQPTESLGGHRKNDNRPKRASEKAMTPVKKGLFAVRITKKIDDFNRVKRRLRTCRFIRLRGRIRPRRAPSAVFLPNFFPR